MTADTRKAGAPLDYDTNTDPDYDSDGEAEGEVPVVFYATNTPGNPIAAAGAHARKKLLVFLPITFARPRRRRSDTDQPG